MDRSPFPQDFEGRDFPPFPEDGPFFEDGPPFMRRGPPFGPRGMHFMGERMMGPRGPMPPFEMFDRHGPRKDDIPTFGGTTSGKYAEELKFRKQKTKERKDRAKERREARRGGKAEFHCITCDRDYSSKEKYEIHTKTHVKCDVEDCAMEASPAVIKLHKLDHHQFLDKQVAWSKDTDAVKKWIEERRRKFPSASNVAAKEASAKAKEESGAVLKTKEFGKMKKKGPMGKADADKKEGEADSTKGEKKDEEADSKEGADIAGEAAKKEEAKAQEGEEEEEISKERQEVLDEIAAEIAVDEDADDQEREGEGGKGDETKDNSKTEVDGEKAQSLIDEKVVVFQSVAKGMVKKPKFRRQKTESWRINKKMQNFRTGRGGFKQRVPLLEMLLAPEIRHERNMVLQCVRYINKNNFFEEKKVEQQPSHPGKKASAKDVKDGKEVKAEAGFVEKGAQEEIKPDVKGDRGDSPLKDVEKGETLAKTDESKEGAEEKVKGVPKETPVDATNETSKDESKVVLEEEGGDAPTKVGADGAPKVGADDAPKVGVDDAPKVGADDAPKVGGAGDASKVGVDDASKVGADDAPKVGAGDAPKVGADDAPKVGADGAPVVGATGAAEEEGKEESTEAPTEIPIEKTKIETTVVEEAEVPQKNEPAKRSGRRGKRSRKSK